MHSNGGVTLSGVEATMFPDYIESLLRILKKEHIHIALETCGYFEYGSFCKSILPYLNTIFYDIKILNFDLHRIFTGKTNRLIRYNLEKLLEEKTVEVITRIPLIPGITDTRKNLEEIIDFLIEIGVNQVQLLPYNPMGMGMYEMLGRKKPPLPEHFIDPEQMKYIKDTVEQIISTRQENP